MKSIEDFISIKNLEILRILLNSEGPISIDNIYSRLDSKVLEEYSQVEDVIRDLTGNHYENYAQLFKWNNVPGDQVSERRLTELIFKYFGKDITPLRDVPTFKKDKNGTILFVLVGNKPIVEITRYDKNDGIDEESSPHYNDAELVILKNRRRIPLHVEENNISLNLNYISSKYDGMLNSLSSYRLVDTFLEYTLGEEYDQSYAEMLRLNDTEMEKDTSTIKVAGQLADTDEINILREKVERIRNDPKSKLYYLNSKGLVLYILNEIADEKIYQNNNTKSLQNTIKNAAKSFVNNFRFLMEYEEFEKILYSINPHNKVYNIEIIKNISSDLKSLLVNSRTDFISYWVTRKYHDELMMYILRSIGDRLLKENENTTKLLQSYSLSILPLINDYLKSESQEIENHINYIRDNDIDSEELHRGFAGKMF